jgi:hypothetical protein
MSMDDQIQRVSEQTGVPSGLLQRAAAARATAAGTPTEVIVAKWAGEEAAAPAAKPAAAPAAAAPAAAAPAAPAADSAAPGVEVLEPVPVAGADAGSEATEDEPEPEVAAPGGFPRWLAAAFLVIPGIALFYALLFPNGPDCGSAGQLAVDPETGLAVNCDGSEFGSEEFSFFGTGEVIYAERCSACHGANGAGGANFPALSGGAVVETFSSCSDHVAWIALGTAGFQEAGIATYGDNEKPVGGAGVPMPGFEGVISEQELIAVSLYERVAFGGEDLAVSEELCTSEEAVASP